MCTHSLLIRSCNSAQFGLPGLQNTALGCTLNYTIMRKPFVQILHNGQFSHPKSTFMTACIPSCQVLLRIKFVLYSLMMKRRFVDVNKPENTYDCGLYAIAYATIYVLMMPYMYYASGCQYCANLDFKADHYYIKKKNLHDGF